MRVIELTQGYVAVVDDDDFEYLAQYRWQFHKDKHGGYASRTMNGDGVRKNILMHIIIMRPPAGIQVDHKNGNKLDNRRCNLRLATFSQNQWNRGTYANNKLKVKGVHYHKANRKYVAQIKVNGVQRYLGIFPTIDLAKAIHDKAALELHGEFARLN